MNWPKVSAVTAIHNRADKTERFLESLDRVDYPNLESIIVDDGSTDRSVEIITSKFPNTVLLQGSGDLWWSGATNLGSRAAIARGASFVMTLNNDIVLDRDCIKASVRCALTNRPAIVGSKIYELDDPQVVWFTGGYFDLSSGDIRLTAGSEDVMEVREVEMLTGMGMLIPVEVFRKIGYFDERNLPQYFADSDFSLRAKAHGFRLVVAPDSVLYNDVASSWSAEEYLTGKLSFILRMLFLKRSPYAITVRFRFYKRHWGRGFRRALLRLYQGWLKTYALGLLARKGRLLIQRLRRVL